MSETDTSYAYRSDRVLIETARMYRPLFPPATVYLTGAQVEMLRNMTQYLNRPNTYVEEYGIEEYTTPDAANFDVIQAIVADLEEKLMGNPNTLWGYDDRWAENAEGVSTGGGATNAVSDTIPAGTVHNLEMFNVSHNDTVARSVFVAVVGDGVTVQMYQNASLAPGIVAIEWGEHTLKAGDVVQFTVWGLASGKTAYLDLWGSKMVVP